MLTMKALVLSALALAIVAPSAAFADTYSDAWYAESVQTGLRAIDATVGQPAVGRPFFVPSPARVRPDASTAPPFWVNFATAGGNTAYAPAFNNSENTLTIPAPYNYKPSNYYYQYNISWTIVNQAGPCTAAYAIAAGGTTIETQKKTGITVSGAGSYDWAFQEQALPTYVGSAVLTGSVRCGTRTNAASTTMYFYTAS
jgi:hypothetical protein